MAQATILGKLVYDRTGSELDLGLLGLLEFAPAAVLVVVVGSVADRVDRRRVVAGAYLVEAVISIGLAAYAHVRTTSIAPAMVLAFAFGVCTAFANPASRSLPADMVGPEALPKLIARSSIAWQGGLIAGPVLGGFLYVVGIPVPFVADAVLLLAGAGAVLVVRVTQRQASGEPDPLVEAMVEASGAAAPSARATWREAIEGLRFVRRHPVVLGAISLDLFAVLFGGAVALLPAIARDRLHVGAVGLGWLRAAGGIGAAVMTTALAVRPVARRVGRILLGAVGVFGVFTILLGVTHDFTVAFLAMLVLSGADAISVFIRATLVPLVTPEDKRGRVLAVENVFIGASNELGAFESGVAGQLLGTSASVVLGGAVTIVVAATWAALFPGLRGVDRFPSRPQ